MRPQLANGTERPSHLVITIHGIRTFGQWQERLENLVTAADPNIEFANYKYGWFSVIGFIFPFFRWLIVRKFQFELIKLSKDKSRSRIDLVGHSFGTHIIAWSIANLDPKYQIQFHTVILSGSVLGGMGSRDPTTTRRTNSGIFRKNFRQRVCELAIQSSNFGFGTHPVPPTSLSCHLRQWSIPPWLSEYGRRRCRYNGPNVNFRRPDRWPARKVIQPVAPLTLERQHRRRFRATPNRLANSWCAAMSSDED
jgi:hypothetical protein